tara:strand:+ start:592 stop:996 length:405 start_codon:yes stop_codon:yes gene_type:complete
MAKAEGKSIPFIGLEGIDVDVLETFESVRGDVKWEPMPTTYETKEFSAVCPFSGLPDVAYVRIDYTPKDKVVELKSLKYYLMSYRPVGVYQEHATRIIAEHLKDCLGVDVGVTTVYNTRGGIDTTCHIVAKATP